MWCLPYDVVLVPGVTSLKSTDSPALSSCQVLIALQLVVGFCPLYSGILFFFFLVRAWANLVCAVSFLENSYVPYWVQIKTISFICPTTPDSTLKCPVPPGEGVKCPSHLGTSSLQSIVLCILTSGGSLCQLATARRSFFDIYQFLKTKIHSAMRFVSFGLDLFVEDSKPFFCFGTSFFSCGGDSEAWEASLGL